MIHREPHNQGIDIPPLAKYMARAALTESLRNNKSRFNAGTGVSEFARNVIDFR